MRVVPLVVRQENPAGALAVLPTTCAVHIPTVFTTAQCTKWTRGVYTARDHWNEDFGGEQFSLGRAFYTHLEEDRSDAYFDDPAASDAIVEEFAPGLQAAMRDLVAQVTGARVIQRADWCGPGVHVFPPDEPVSKHGGVCHYDTEGLTARHIEARRGAVTLVAMFQPPASGGGLKVWDVRYSGRDEANDDELAAPSEIVTYGVGDVVLIEAYRLHQIQPFGGSRERISATIHAAELDVGLWETWF